MQRTPIQSLIAALCGAATLCALPAQAQSPTQAPGAACSAKSSAVAPTVVELYTSEGCSSCPPADRWLSTLKGKPDVLALAFHVNYWDRLGWVDRFASPEFTSRQYEMARVVNSAQVYTPQVLAAGRDWRDWPRLPKSASESPVVVSLVREGENVIAQVSAPVTTNNGTGKALSGSLSAYWAVLEDGHQSKVRAGENRGETLNHDHVVRLYKAVPTWPAADGISTQLQVSRGVPEHPRRVVFVVTDAASQRPVQAVSLSGC
jgi:hypothetical protein